MKKHFLTLCLSALMLSLCAATTYNPSESPNPNTNAENPAFCLQTPLFKAVANKNDVFPANCDTMGIAWGDLNKDGIQDVVIVATPRLPEKMQTRDDGFVYNFNSPVMGIYFGTKDGKLKLYKEYNNTIPGNEDESYFVELEMDITDKGVLTLRISNFYTAGSTNNEYAKYLYRYQNNDFFLIGADTGSMSRFTGENETVSVNYLTNKKQTIVSDLFDDSVKPKETWTSIPKKPLEKLGAKLLDAWFEH